MADYDGHKWKNVFTMAGNNAGAAILHYSVGSSFQSGRLRQLLPATYTKDMSGESRCQAFFLSVLLQWLLAGPMLLLRPADISRVIPVPGGGNPDDHPASATLDRRSRAKLRDLNRVRAVRSISRLSVSALVCV